MYFNIPKIMTLLMLGATVFVVKPGYAEVPHTINYQGYLTDSDSVAVSGPVSMTFRLYNVESGGSPLWEETQTVQVNNGIYAAALGSVTVLDPAIIDGNLWLGVTVEADAEMAPRQKLQSVPFALRARTLSGQSSVVQRLDYLEGDYFNQDVRFADNGDGTVSDSTRNLMWQKQVGVMLNWCEASGEFSSQYNPESYAECGSSNLAGFTDWRLPTVDELLSLEDNRFYQINQNPNFSFSGNETMIWASEWTQESPTAYVFYVLFDNFQAIVNATGKGAGANVTCVRDMAGG